MSGHSLLELLVALTVALVVLGTAMALAVSASSGYSTIPEHGDTLQRLRTAVLALSADLAGTVDGGGRWPAVVPCGWGGDPAGGTSGPCARADTVTVVVPQRDLWMAADTAAGDTLSVIRPSGCPAPDSSCVFARGDDVILSDGHGRAAPFRVEGKIDTELAVPGLEAYGAPVADSVLTSGLLRTYYLRWDTAVEAYQLRRIDGASDQPVTEHLTHLGIEYFGEAAPPILRGETARPSYGPAPLRSAGAEGDAGAWLPTCAFDVQDGLPVSRMGLRPAEPDGLARFVPADFLDGPWCPDPESAWRVDLDLYRVTRVRLSMGVQASTARFRANIPDWFRRPGTATEGHALVPDLAATFVVALRGAGR